MSITAQSPGDGLVKQVAGIDLSADLSKDLIAEINRVFADNVVLCFRGQSFAGPAEFLGAAKRFGEPMPQVVKNYRLPGFDEIEVLSNDQTDKRLGDGKPLYRGGSWHTDHSNMEFPPKATMLYAIQIPDTGGDTEFVNMYDAYDALPQSMKNRIETLWAFHAYQSSRAPRKLQVRTAEEAAISDGTMQPLVRVNPDTGRKALYMNPMRIEYIEGMSRKESDDLLDELYAHCERKEFFLAHKWAVGDLLIWDNRSAWHRATFNYDMSQRRYMHRIMIRGERPVGVTSKPASQSAAE